MPRAAVAIAGRRGPLWGLALALVLGTATRGDDADGADAPVWAEPPIIMQADRIRVWDRDGCRWVLLDGAPAVFQGPEAPPRGTRALVRIRSRKAADGGPRSARAELYTLECDDPLAQAPRLVYETSQRVVLRARTVAGVTRLDGPPDDLPPLGTKAKAPVAIEAPPLDEAAPTVAEPAPADGAEGLALIEPPPNEELMLEDAGESGAVEAAAVEAAAAPEAPAPIDPPTQPETPPPLDALPVELGVSRAESPSLDADVAPAQDPGEVPGFVPDFDDRGIAPDTPVDDLPQGPPTELSPLPPPVEEPRPEGPAPARVPGDAAAPLLPETRRFWSIAPRYGGRKIQVESFKTSDGATAYVIRGGVQIVSEVPGRGIIDLAADHAVIWTRPAEGENAPPPIVGGSPVEQDVRQPLEVYLEGNVVIRNDRLEVAGPADQTKFEARQAYYDFRTDRVVALEGEVNVFAPGLVAPLRTKGQVINQYRSVLMGPNGTFRLGAPLIAADVTTTTGSRFPEPGYRFDSRAVDIMPVDGPLTDPTTGATVGPPRSPLTPRETTWQIDSRQNVWYIGPVPVFYWPRIVTTDDLDPPIRNLSFRYGTYFGYQVLTDWSAFKLLGLRRPNWIDNWNIDIDYLHLRGPALGSEIGWFGRDLVGDLRDPYRKGTASDVDRPYFGYFDVWGILDHHNDVLGTGPAVVTYGPPGAGKAGFQRDNVPSFQTPRGRFLFRHMQSLLGPDAPREDDFRVQLEGAGYSDRHFLEQYYKRLFDVGLDQDTLFYGIYQHRNTATTVTAQVNYMNWITDTQWLPKAEYYRIGDSLLGNLFSYSSNYGVDYANVHTAVEVNNPNIFAFIPYDPISNTSGPWTSGRGWTTHELDMPINLGVLRVVPYGQGQLMGWSNQLDGRTVGRAWGAFGARLDMMAWRTFPNFESELLNVHGLAHKINVGLDYRNAFSTMPLSRIGIQDNYDDDTYEFGRRYFALTNYVGGILPPQYDPRFLVLRRTLNPVVFTPDIQDEIETLTLHVNQRLQTKRGPDGRRRITDWMISDFQTTFFPRSTRDNFGEPIGQTMYDYEWFLGDRTSFVTTGWFEFWNIDGNPILVTEPRKSNDPFGLKVVTAGISINRPPRGNFYVGYSIINTGPIATSALNMAFNYWMSPKWYSSWAISYDFGNAILLGTTFSVTKIGKDYLTSVGLSVDPQRHNYTFGVELAPRFSPNVRLGSAVGTRFDSRFAPSQ
jgi:hypothetical protein